MIGKILVAHLVGDYVLQSHWMASKKITNWLPAIIHGVLYTLPFLLITQHPAALGVICSTHIIIDRYRLAKHLSWLKNLIGPSKKTYQYTWDDGETVKYHRKYETVDQMGTRPVHRDMSVAPPFDNVKTIRHPLTWQEAKENSGYPKDVPVWLSTWLMIITDNTLHIVINILAIVVFGT